MTTLNVSIVCFLTSYLICFLMEARRLSVRTSLTRQLLLGFGLVGLFVHTIYLYIRATERELPPLLTSTQDWILVLSWILILIYILLTIADNSLSIGIFLLPVILLLIVSAYFVSDQTNEVVRSGASYNMAANRGWIVLHTSLLAFGVGGLILCLVVSMMYLVQHRRLKHKHGVQPGWKLPNLQLLGRLNWWGTIISIPLLTLGMMIGLTISRSTSHQPQVSLSDPVIVINGVLCLILVFFFIWFVFTNRQTGCQVSRVTITATAFFLVVLIGTQILAGRGIPMFDSWHSQVLYHSDIICSKAIPFEFTMDGKLLPPFEDHFGEVILSVPKL